jgi:hypothetical protein
MSHIRNNEGVSNSRYDADEKPSGKQLDGSSIDDSAESLIAVRQDTQ